uniref:Uncharacterized protein n=1 Tax=Cyprinus carpio carpio TaxID=630221 RepID=A0A9J8A9M5_CYPCA
MVKMLMCTFVRTRKGADALLLAQVKTLHESVLRAGQQHVDLSGVKADFIDRALVFGEQLLLFVTAGPRQIPHHHGSVSGGGGQQVLLHLMPHDVRTAEVQPLHETVFLQTVYLENISPGNHHLKHEVINHKITDKINIFIFTFIQSDLQMRTMEAIKINKRAMIYKCYNI